MPPALLFRSSVPPTTSALQHKAVTVESGAPVNQQLKDSPYRWLNVPRWYLWDGGFLLIG